MAQRKQRATSHTAKAPKRGTRRKPSERAQARMVKRIFGKAKRKKRVTKTKSQRAVTKRVAPRKARSPKQSGKSFAETVIVDMIEEPVPGIMVVTEFESVRVREPSATTEHLGETQGRRSFGTNEE